MTENEQLIAMAELTGELKPPVCKPSVEQLEAVMADHRPRRVVTMPDGQIRAVRDYLVDLNAMAELEVEARPTYWTTLAQVTSTGLHSIHWRNFKTMGGATAPQRVESYLRDHNRWVS